MVTNYSNLSLNAVLDARNTISRNAAYGPDGSCGPRHRFLQSEGSGIVRPSYTVMRGPYAAWNTPMPLAGRIKFVRSKIFSRTIQLVNLPSRGIAMSFAALKLNCQTFGSSSWLA